MRILHVISTLDPAYGGPAEGVRQLTAAYSKTGVTPFIVTVDDPGAAYLALPHAETVGLGPAHGGVFRYSSRLAGWLKAHVGSFDAVIVHGLWQHTGIAVWAVLRNTRKPYFVFPHGMLDPWFNHQYPLKHIKKALYWRLFQHRILSAANRVLFTCEEERRVARLSFEPYRVREHVVHYGTTAPAIDEAACRETFLSRFPDLAGKRLILFLGRLHEKKGCDLLIEAFSGFASSHPEVQLVMAGPDQDGSMARLQQAASRLGIADRVTWTGLLQGNLKWGAFLASEVFTLPSHQENFGIAIAEAMSLGRPVLISDKVNIHREIETDQAGYVEPDTLEGTKSLLRRWLSLSSVDRSAYGVRARACFESRFEIHKAAAELVSVVAKAAEASREQ